MMDLCKMEIKHFSHDHPLILSEEKYNTKFRCGVCSEPIFGLSYCCQICPYILHKWCSDLPFQLPSHKHHLPDHPLILTPRTPSESSTPENCKICKNEIQFPGSAYTCIIKECCSFSLHVECASFLEMINFDFPNIYGKTNISTIYYIRKYQEGCICVICGHDCSGPLFFTFDIIGTRYLHVHCAMLPHKVKHKRHLHDLTLRPPLDEKTKYFEFFCDVCEQERDPDDHVYYCEPCELVAHIACGVTGTERPIQDILGTYPELNSPVYEMPERVQKEDELSKLTEHYEVARKVKEDDKYFEHVSHQHALVLFNYGRPEQVSHCHGCRSSIYGKTYVCKCDFHLHRWCAQLPEKIEHNMHCGRGSLKLFPYPGQLLINSFKRKSVTNKWKSNPQTNLIISDFEDEKMFNSQAYFCKVCFTPIDVTSDTSGFLYTCDICDAVMHVICAMLPKNLTHRSHEHTLCLYEQKKVVVGWGREPLCQACKFPCEILVSLYCESCDFYLHVQCFLLPHTGKHITHRHNLNLTYSYKEDPRALEYFCDTCEKPRIPDRWVYCCPDPDCSILGHTDCVFPNPFAMSKHSDFEEFLPDSEFCIFREHNDNYDDENDSEILNQDDISEISRASDSDSRFSSSRGGNDDVDSAIDFEKLLVYDEFDLGNDEG